MTIVTDLMRVSGFQIKLIPMINTDRGAAMKTVFLDFSQFIYFDIVVPMNYVSSHKGMFTH